jgi:hypothetical protein
MIQTECAVCNKAVRGRERVRAEIRNANGFGHACDKCAKLKKGRKNEKR